MSIDTIVILNRYMILPLFFIGSIFHFVYNWSRHNKKIATFVAVNESYWEHIKIAFWPVLFLYVVEYVFGGYKIMSFVPAAATALYTLPISMIAIVYGYKKIFKKNILALDISTFFITVAIAQSIFNLVLHQLNADIYSIGFGILFLTFIVIGFITFTKSPPLDPDIFKDPITEKYGLKGHK